MRWMGKLARGIIAALDSSGWEEPGSAPPVVSEVHASWAGCDYAIRVTQCMRYEPYPKTVYRISARVAAEASGAARATLASVVLGESETVPAIAIAANDAGLVVGYSEEASYGSIGTLSNGHAVQLDPRTLAVVRHVKMFGGASLPTGTAGGWGSLKVGRLTIVNHATLVVEGTLSGNHIDVWTVQGVGGYWSTPYDGSSPRATSFSATFPGFFTRPQAPSLIIY
ncbi:hypothetical protein [Hyalangium versicolor]|uniref:hypothetical protein n=1 Tax=Hyalangium versicolor TaxID=2861190 RepID=UPI001CCC3D29|nr:hypothetical protein [Hyalangium versicolor]